MPRRIATETTDYTEPVALSDGMSEQSIDYSAIYRNAETLYHELEASLRDLAQQRKSLMAEQINDTAGTDAIVEETTAASARIVELEDAIERAELAIRLAGTSGAEPLIARRDRLVQRHEEAVAELDALTTRQQQEQMEQAAARAARDERQAALDEQIATVVRQMEQTQEAAQTAHAAWGAREHAALVEELTAIQRRIQQAERERSDADWALREVRATITDRLAHWPTLREQVTREYVPAPAPREDATTRLLSAWATFLGVFEEESPRVDERILASLAWSSTDILVLSGHRLPPGAFASQAATIDVTSAQARRDKRAGAERAIRHYREGKLPDGRPMTN